MSARPHRLRWLKDGPASGPWNMGLDEALLHSALGGVATFRLYAWDGPWLSLGYGQRADRARVERCQAAGVGVVRRATGGAAVLHGSDLTYAVAAPEGQFPPGLEGAYRLVSDALVEALRGVGVEAWRSPGSRRRGAGGRPFDCFLEPGADEICAGLLGSRKLVGSAQRRTAGAVLQHGSIRLFPDPPSAIGAAGLAHGAATSLDELGCSADKEEVGSGLAHALAKRLGLRLAVDVASSAESAYALARMRSHASDPLAPPAPLGELPSRGLPAGR